MQWEEEGFDHWNCNIVDDDDDVCPGNDFKMK